MSNKSGKRVKVVFSRKEDFSVQAKCLADAAWIISNFKKIPIPESITIDGNSLSQEEIESLHAEWVSASRKLSK